MEKSKKDKEVLKKRYFNEILNNPENQEFFSAYDNSSFDDFVEAYAEHKADMEIYGEFSKLRLQRKIEKFRSEAWDAIREIQFKKLFDAECLWRAEQECTVTDVDIELEFKVKSFNIYNYRGLPPVSEAEISFYQDYLRKPITTLDRIITATHYPDYQEQKQVYEEDGKSYYSYFDYHSRITGTYKLLNLPDLRTPKEAQYLLKAKKDVTTQTPAATDRNTGEFLNCYLYDHIEKFAKFLGDKKMVSFIRDREKWEDDKHDYIFDWAYSYLEEIAPERVPIQAHSSWRMGLYLAAINHQRNKIADILPAIHEEYLMKLETGILMDTYELLENYEDLAEELKNRILDAREEKGEPRDFNF